jgi:hypothetical protein
MWCSSWYSQHLQGKLVEVVPEALARSVRAHNGTSHELQRLRLRPAMHAGEVTVDDHGAISTTVTTTFRLLDALPFKQALHDSSGDVALIVSRWMFDEVVRHSAAVEPSTFRPIFVTVKETRATAWIALPDQPYPAAPTVLDQPTGDPETTVPRQLPSAPTAFVGRTDELAELTATLALVRHRSSSMDEEISSARSMSPFSASVRTTVVGASACQSTSLIDLRVGVRRDAKSASFG